MSARLFMKATQNTSYQILQAFLDHGWDINTPIDSNTPPGLAFSYHDADLTMWFLAHGANPNQRCDKDCTPLSVAFEVASFEIIQILLDHGASLSQGQVMHYAAVRQFDDRLQVLEFLLEKGLPINNIMYQDSEDYNANMFSGIGTPLHYAAERGLLDSVELLVERGASTRIRDPAGQIALEWAEFNNQKAVVDFLRPLSVGNDSQSVAQFTDEPGRHFTTTPLE
ncbi:uncharacterized protein N7479_003372 [Penicillium vulpinum]|uniref:Uncharacterized protein n=1 Tax=Penicillium vulpinum TaxID=29845 RepID=A0A1V6QXD3_9EURO|nr:uncharacterized protein N7479_003372 [Penicillium vulpinum]KAJ5963496.1 hypothetical protein N7479_003372 [Penicillium vulpinum]OQD93839.1 hypothetical protein PENVUL_c169G06761 [Penicillium vulpinum]